MNQARSPFAAAVLARLFPDETFHSSGIAANTSSNFLEQVVATATSWQIPMAKGESKSITDDRQAILNSDLVICAESGYAKPIRDLGYLGKIICFEELLPEMDFMPQDPEGLGLDKLRRELGKSACLATRALLQIKPPRNGFVILAVIPNGTTDLQLALTQAQFERDIRGAVLIDSDLRSPYIAESKELGLKRKLFDCLDLNPNLEIAKDEILSHCRDLETPEAIFLDPRWLEFVSTIAQKSPVVLICAPRNTKVRPLADSYLAAILADEISIISS